MVITSKAVKQMGEEIEKELFTLYRGISPKYKSWCKAFLLMLRDESNVSTAGQIHSLQKYASSSRDTFGKFSSKKSRSKDWLR